MFCTASSPNLKNTGYDLRQRTQYLTLPADINTVAKQNFVYRMLFRDIYYLSFMFHCYLTSTSASLQMSCI